MSNQEFPVLNKLKYNFAKFVLDHKRVIEIGLDVSHSIHNFALSKSPLSFIEGGVRAVMGLSRNLNAYSAQFFNPQNCWQKIVCARDERPLYSIFEPVIIQYPFKRLIFQYDDRADIGIYTLPLCQLGFDKNGIWLNSADGVSSEQVLQFLIKEKVKELKSKFFSIVSSQEVSPNNYMPVTKFDLQDEEINAIESQTSKEYQDYIQSFLDKGINRSFLFTGPPGVGKTTLTQTLIHQLGFNTLKFKYDPKQTNLSTVRFLVTSLNVEAVVLDDFDQVSNTNHLFEFLAWLNNNVKLTLLVTNSNKEFHPAIKRPGRIDQIFTINHLDKSVAETILGDLKPELVEKVKEWPIAFINELKFRLTANPDRDVQKDLAELEQRVVDQQKM